MEIDINSREKLIAALEQAGKSQLRKKKARLREIYDAVLLAKSQDLGEKTIMQLLSAQGLHFESRSAFAVTMHRIKKDVEKEASLAASKTSPVIATNTQAVAAPQLPAPLKTKGEEPQKLKPQKAHFSSTAQQRREAKANRYTSSMDDELALKLILGAKQ